MKHIYIFTVLVMTAVVGLSESSPARILDIRDAFSSSTGYLASSQWISGKVEAVETYGDHKYIRIDGIQYRMMPKVSIARRVYRGRGAFDEVSAAFQDVRENSDVMLRVQGFRIYQILILE